MVKPLHFHFWDLVLNSWFTNKFLWPFRNLLLNISACSLHPEHMKFISLSFLVFHSFIWNFFGSFFSVDNILEMTISLYLCSSRYLEMIAKVFSIDVHCFQMIKQKIFFLIWCLYMFASNLSLSLFPSHHHLSRMYIEKRSVNKLYAFLL